MTRKNKAVVEDGRRIKDYVRLSKKDRDLNIAMGLTPKRQYVLDSDQVIQLFRRHVRKALGDAVENRTRIYASNGYFRVRLPPANGRVNATIKDKFWKKALVDGTSLRRVSLALALRAMYGEVLT